MVSRSTCPVHHWDHGGLGGHPAPQVRQEGDHAHLLQVDALPAGVGPGQHGHPRPLAQGRVVGDERRRAQLLQRMAARLNFYLLRF